MNTSFLLGAISREALAKKSNGWKAVVAALPERWTYILRFCESDWEAPKMALISDGEVYAVLHIFWTGPNRVVLDTPLIKFDPEDSVKGDPDAMHNLYEDSVCKECERFCCSCLESEVPVSPVAHTDAEDLQDNTDDPLDLPENNP